MPLQRPTLGQLASTAEAEINALVPNADARMRLSILNVFARVWAALTDGLYGALDFLSRQLFAVTATRQYLTLIADSYGVNRLAPAAATGCIRLAGAPGTVVLAGTVFQRGDGVQYRTLGGAVLPASGIFDAGAIAVTAGAAGNAAPAVTLQPASSMAGLTGASVCPAGIAGGAEEESDEALRARLLQRLRNPPGAGTASDWERWAREWNASVTRVWVLPAVSGNGTVGIVFAQDGLGIVPSPGAIIGMAAHLAQYAPAGVDLQVIAPVLKPVPLTVSETPTGDPAVRQAIVDAVADLLYREGGPGGTIPLTHFAEAISGAAGEYTHSLIAPAAQQSFSGNLPTVQLGVLGPVTWV